MIAGAIPHEPANLIPATSMQERSCPHCGFRQVTAARVRYRCSGCGKRIRVGHRSPRTEYRSVVDYEPVLDILRNAGIALTVPQIADAIFDKSRYSAYQFRLLKKQVEYRIRLAEHAGKVQNKRGSATWSLLEIPVKKITGQVMICHFCGTETQTFSRTDKWTCSGCKRRIRFSTSGKISAGDYIPAPVTGESSRSIHDMRWGCQRNPLNTGSPDKPPLRILKILYDAGKPLSPEEIGMAAHRPRNPMEFEKQRKNLRDKQMRKWALKTLQEMQSKGWVREIRPVGLWIPIIARDQVMI